uniref:Uncharacterized protein n=1 Tax=Octopus bimaculoides TaxID=37653 RepID=A0A0L8GT11_OCTBM
MRKCITIHSYRISYNKKNYNLFRIEVTRLVERNLIESGVRIEISSERVDGEIMKMKTYPCHSRRTYLTLLVLAALTAFGQAQCKYR